MSIKVAISASLRPSAAAPGVLTQVIDAFGGLDALDPAVGRITGHVAIPGSVSYTLQIPTFSVSASLEGFTSACVVGGRQPRLVQSGDFLEKVLAGKLDSLDELVRRTHPVTLDPVALRSALRLLLDVESHRSCITPCAEAPPGITPTYSSRVRAVVHQALKSLEQSSLFRFMSAGGLAAPVTYIAAHRIVGMSAADAIGLAVAPVVLAYLASAVSMRVTLSSLQISPDTYRFLSASTSRKH